MIQLGMYVIRYAPQQNVAYSVVMSTFMHFASPVYVLMFPSVHNISAARSLVL